MPDNWRNILPYVWIREIQGPIFIVPPFFYSGIIRSARPSERFSEQTSETEGDIDSQGSAFRIPADRVIFSTLRLRDSLAVQELMPFFRQPLALKEGI